jgi:hypothetical protein
MTMGPEDNTPPRIEVYYMNNEGWDKLDPEAAEWVKMYLEAFMNQLDHMHLEFDTEQASVQSQLAELARLDAQVADAAECPEALAWITQAVQRVRRGD